MSSRAAGTTSKLRRSRRSAGNRAPEVARRSSSAKLLHASPSHVPHAIRSIPIIELQRLAGNSAVAITLQRDPNRRRSRRRKKPDATRALWRDVRTAPLEDLQRELKAVQDELFTTSTKSQRGKDLFASMTMLKNELKRRERLPRIEQVRRDLDFLAGRQERVLDSARFTSTLASDHFLGPFERDMNNYIVRFQKAYDKVDAVLTKAKAREEMLHKIRDGLVGVAIGTGVGLTASAIWKSAEGFKQIAIEVGGEVVEWLLGQGYAQIAPASSKWEIPASMQPTVQALVQTKKLLDAWKGVALMQATTLDVLQIQKTIRAQDRRLDTEEGELALLDIERRTQTLKAGNASLRMIEKLLEMNAGLHAFRNAAEYGINRSDWRLEQDIWIAWIKALGPSPGGDRPYHEAVRDVKDELEAAGVFHRLGIEGQGWRGPDLSGAPDAATRDAQAQTHVDKLAVVISPASGGAYVVRLRHDAYTGAPQQDPDPGGPQQYLRARPTTSNPLTSGDVVKVHDVHEGDVKVFGTGWGTRPVSKDELDFARAMTAVHAM